MSVYDQRGQKVGVQYNIAGNAVIEKLPLFVGVPAMPKHFVGRETQVAALVGKLTQGGSYALSAEGLPGVGKTTLAIALAHHRDVLARFKDGVLWAGLGPQGDAAGELLKWADGLGIDITDRASDKDRSEAVKQAIGDRAVLLIVDDAWQLEPAQLLRCGGPNCVHLLTTRDQALALSFAGRVESVEELSPQAAREFLQELALKAYGTDPELADRLLEAVGYLPLAVELLGGYLNAGARRRFAEQSLAALDELTDPARRLELAGKRIGASGDITLHDTIALSLDGLGEESEAAVQVFYGLGAFAPKPARFTAEAAEVVTDGDTDVFALLADRNLLEIGEDESLALHQTLCDVARTRTADGSYHRHRDYYLALVNEDLEDWQWIEAVYDQVQQAWRRLLVESDTPRLLEYVWALRIYQERRALWRDTLEWAKCGSKWAQDNDHHSDDVALLNNIGHVYSVLGDVQPALDYFNLVLSRDRAEGNSSGEATALTNIGKVYNDMGEKRLALETFDKATCLFRRIGDVHGEATTLNNMGSVYDGLGDIQQALKTFLRSLPLRRSVGDVNGEAATLTNIGAVHYKLGNYHHAIGILVKAQSLMISVGDTWGERVSRFNIAMVYRDMGELDKAAEQLVEVVKIDERVGHPDLESDREALAQVRVMRKAAK